MKRFFYRLPAELMEEYGATVAVVYAVLLDACQEGIFRADLKTETIAKKTKTTVRCVITAINKLEELGLVKRTKEGRRTVYDVVPVLPPKKREENYIPESYHMLGDTYRDIINRIPNLTIRHHYANLIVKHGCNLDQEALFSLRYLSFMFDKEREKELRAADTLGDQTRIAETGAMTKFIDYDEDEQAEFSGQLSFFSGGD